MTMLQPVPSTVPLTVPAGLMSAAVMLMLSRKKPVGVQTGVAIALVIATTHPHTNKLSLYMRSPDVSLDVNIRELDFGCPILALRSITSKRSGSGQIFTNT